MDTQDQAAAPAPAGDGTAAAAYTPRPGELARYEHEVTAPTPGTRTQLILVTEVTGEGRARGLPVGYLDQAAEFPAGMLAPLEG